MDESTNIKSIPQVQVDLPSLIIDKSSRIIALNPEVKKIIPSAAPQANFFELFDEQTLLSLQRIFIDARKYEIASKDVIEIKIGEESQNVEITFAPLRSESNIYFLVGFKLLSEKKVEIDTKKFWIATSELEKITNNKRIITIANKVKLSYPFTFIEKAKIQKEINELEQLFWVKETGGKYILANEKYAASLGFSTTQLENKNEKDFLPKYLLNLYDIVDQYIVGSGNVVILEGITSPITSSANKDIQIVEFPIYDLDNKVVAIIGFSQKASSYKLVDEVIDPIFFTNISQPIILIDNENNIRVYSKDFVRLMLLNDKVDYKKQNINQIFEKNFITVIDTYLKNPENTEIYNFNHVFVEKGNLITDVSVHKLLDANGSYIGAQLFFNAKNEFQLLIESKAQLYDLLLHNSPEAMFVYDFENLKFLEVNDAALKLYGYKRNDFLNMDLTDLYAPEDIQTLIQSSDSKTAGTNLANPWRHKKSDGSSILVELTRYPIDFNGKKAHLNIARNVTEQVNEKKKLQVLSSSFEHTGDLIIITDKDGFITNINDPVSKKIGYSIKELELRPLISLVSDDDRAKINKNIFHSGLLKTTSIEVDFKKPSGNLLKVILIATPIKNYNGEIDSFLLIVKPIEDKSLIKDINHTHEEEAEKIDPPFLSNMFHEILTPINVILGFTQELWETLDTPSEEQKEAVEIIKENQKLLLQIMDNAVDYSTLQQKVIKFRPEQIKFVDILEGLKDNIRKAADSKKIDFAYGKISSSLIVETDKQKFISLLSLFIKFAIQITKENSIYLSAYNIDENNFAVTIKDSRHAITSYLLKGLNEIFSDDESISRRNYGFSRFSTRLANKLIELLSAQKKTITKGSETVEYALAFPIKFVIGEKGKIEVETTKIISPAGKTKSKAPSIDESEKSVARKITEKDLQQFSCLYLEDQVDSQILFRNQMKDLKTIEITPSFEMALPLLKTKRFDFLVMDINLQGEYNGLDALRIIQQMPGYKNVPVIASTAFMQHDARENFMAAGFTEFISKPLLRDKVIEVLLKIFNK